jgi:glycosyltransferase involved in cell wall biosynthesis
LENNYNAPRFTIIIPTKDRADFLYQTLRTCSIQEYENFEVIVSDDGSSDHTFEVVSEAARKDPRIRYVTPGSGVGMLDNFEFALDQVKPGYVLALGGDDGLLPYSISRMRDILEDTGKELLTWSTPAYFYPKTKMENGQLILNIEKGFRKRGVKIIQSKTFLERQAKNLFYISDIETPMFYVKGVVSTRLVEKVKSRSSDGRFYACSTPDGYSGIVLAGEVDEYAFSYEPLTIHGVSPTSAGVNYLASNELAKKQSESFFKLAANKPMHSELCSQPYSPLISLMTADYLLTAKDLPGWPGGIPKINYQSLISKALAELEDGLFAEDRVSRELLIIYRIAEQHGLSEYFYKKLKVARRNKRKTLEGNALSTRLIYLDANEYKIYNVFDAAYVANYFYQVGTKVSFLMFWEMCINSIKYRLLSFKKGTYLPEESEWLDSKTD